MKYFFMFCIALQSLIFSDENLQFPDEYTLTKRILSLTSVFDFDSAEGAFAMAKERFFALATSIDFEDSKGNLIASAQDSIFSWGSYLTIVDRVGQPIGFIEESIWNFLPTYRIYNPAKQLIAVASLNFWGTAFYITDPNNPEKIYAAISRPFIYLLREYWTVNIIDREIFEQKIIDHRALGILAIYQSIFESRLRLWQTFPTYSN